MLTSDQLEKLKDSINQFNSKDFDELRFKLELVQNELRSLFLQLDKNKRKYSPNLQSFVRNPANIKST